MVRTVAVLPRRKALQTPIGFSKWACALTVLFSCIDTCGAIAQTGPVPATYKVRNFGTRESNVAVTFGSVFLRGDVPRGFGVAASDREGKAIPVQLDPKATHPDGSLRHAV